MMTEHHKDLLGMISTALIVGASIYVVHSFIPSMLWAAIITIITFPASRWFYRHMLPRRNASAFLFTLIVTLVIFMPMVWVVSILLRETQVFIDKLITLHQHGGSLPQTVTALPWIGPHIANFWQKLLESQNGLSDMTKHLHLSLTSTSYYLQKLGKSVVHRSIQFGFTLLCLFFFYRDGHEIAHQIDKVGERCLGDRWREFAIQLPQLLRSTLNGTVLVGIGVGILMGAVYFALGFPAPTIAGFATAFAAMVPFIVPVVFIAVALIFASMGALISAFLVLLVGTIVMFIADHFIKPLVIGGNTRLHFLMVLFGLLGGVQVFGVMGLFLGPIVMVLFLALWRELLHY